MVLYKQVILTNLKSSPADTAKMFQELTGFLLSRGGVVRDLSNRGHRVLGYPIDDRRWGGNFERHREAKLVVKTFETNPATLKELENKMKLSYPVLRFMTFKVQKDPLRDVLKQSMLAAEPIESQPEEKFDWDEFKASLNDNVKVIRTDYIGEEPEDPMQPIDAINNVADEDDDDDEDEEPTLTPQQQEMFEWLMKKANNGEAVETDSLISALEEATQPTKSDNAEYWEDDDFEFEDEKEDKAKVEVPDWQKDSSYTPQAPRSSKKD